MKLVPRLFKQLEVLSLLFGDKKPDLRKIIGTVTAEVIYIFGDASGSVFEDSWT